MKKLALLVLAASLCCIPVTAQQAEGITITAAGRADVSPSFPGGGVSFDNSALYTFIDGQLGDHFSYSICNHWLSTQPGDLYRNTFRSDDVNWLSYCYADFTFGNWDIVLGKNLLNTLGYEYDPWDWENHSAAQTPLSNSLNCFEWGATLSYTTASGLSTFSAQMAASPYGEHPFSSGLWAYTAQWRGEYGFFSPVWSYAALQMDKGSYQHVVNLGNRFSLGEKFDLTLDWVYATAGEEVCSAGYNCIRGELGYTPSEHFCAKLLSYCHFEEELDSTDFNIGAYAYFFPLENNTEDLRIHAGLSYNTLMQTATLSVGAFYLIRIRCW